MFSPVIYSDTIKVSGCVIFSSILVSKMRVDAKRRQEKRDKSDELEFWRA